jgi:hypothetical protein
MYNKLLYVMKHDRITKIILEKTDMDIDEQGYILNPKGERVETIKGNYVKITDLGSLGTAIFYDDVLPDEIKKYIRK